MAYKETIETRKYPSYSSWVSHYCNFELTISCDTLSSQTGYLELKYELNFHSYNLSGGSYGGGNRPAYQASNVTFTVNGNTEATGEGPYVPSRFDDDLPVASGKFRAFLDDNAVCSFSFSIDATIREGSSGTPTSYSYSSTKSLGSPSGVVYYAAVGNTKPTNTRGASAHASWTLQTQNVLTNSSVVRFYLAADSEYRGNKYYATITPLNGPDQGKGKTLTIAATSGNSDSVTFSIPHPTNTSQIARFRMEVGMVVSSTGGGYSGIGVNGRYDNNTQYNAAATEEFILPKIFRNIAEIHNGTEYKAYRVYIYKDGVWKRAQPYVYTDGAYVSA